MTLRPLITLLALAPGLALAQATFDGGLLRDAQGRTLYTFDKDGAASACDGGCAAAWPPLVAAPEARAAGPLTLHARSDGSRQWGWNGRPLYRYAGDAQPGDARGDGQGGVWRVVRPGGAGAAAAAAHSSPYDRY